MYTFCICFGLEGKIGSMGSDCTLLATTGALENVLFCDFFESDLPKNLKEFDRFKRPLVSEDFECLLCCSVLSGVNIKGYVENRN